MAALSFPSPGRMLDNIKRMEEAELPSLPSIQPNFDYDSAFETSQESIDDDYAHGNGYERDQEQVTPHPHRQSRSTLAASTIVPDHENDQDSSFGDGTSSVSSAPFPPLPRAKSSSPESPYIPGRASTSTPFSLSSSRRFVSDNNDTRSTARHLGHSRNRSDTGEYGAANASGKEAWHTPGQMSGSFSGEEIQPELPSLPGIGELGSERSIPLKDMTEDSFESLPAETPLSRRFSQNNVVVQRPGRRSHSLLQHSAASPNYRIPTPISENESPASPQMSQQDRVPSLSKSEASATDTSGAASTPEAPSRQMAAGTPSFARVLHEDEHASHVSEGSNHDAPTYEYQYSASADAFEDTPAPRRRVSPNKMWADTPASAHYSTPGFARDPPQVIDQLASGYKRHEDSYGALRDMTNRYGDMPFTPSPAGLLSKNSDLSTPRAPLNDVERRKSHVLAVLSSSGIHQRRPHTPHPLRRVSMSPTTTIQEGTPSQSQGPYTPSAFDRSSSAPPNESFVSVASSADLTTDRRAVGHARLSRGNTSFPNILLPSHAANTSGQSSVRATNDRRADGVKIHKHLNAMNKQLLESNADLAREAEAWRDEANRLKSLLTDAGVDHSEVDVLANIAKSREASFALDPQDSAQQLLDGMSPEENAAVMQELAEKLENLEEILNDKDAQIVELQEEVATLRESGGEGKEETIAALQEQIDEGERARAELHSEFALKTERHAAQFAEICTSFEKQVGDLGKQLTEAKAEVERVKVEKERLEDAAASSSGGEDTRRHVALRVELDRARESLAAKVKQLEDVEAQLSEVMAERDEIAERADGAEGKVEELERELDQVDADLQAKEEAVEGLIAEKEDLEREVQEIRLELQTAASKDDEGQDAQTAQIESLQQQIRQLEVELESRPAADIAQEAEQLRDEVDELNRLLEDRDAEIEGIQGKLELAELAAQPMRQSIASPRKSTSGRSTAGQDIVNVADASTSADEISKADQASFVAAIEDRLDEAYREIGRLKNELSSTPHRKSTMEMKDAKIKALEREKAALQERVGNKAMPATPAGVMPAASPFGKPTPMFYRALAHLKTPKTPGNLKELSWLQTTVSDANEPILRAQVEYLQKELDNVNGQLDGNFSRLEEAGLGAMALAEKLAAAQTRISELEDEIRALLQRNKASLALVHAQREENGRADEERLHDALAAVHDQLDSLKAESNREKTRMASDNSRLKAAIDELRATSEQEIERMHRETEDLLDAAHSDVEQAKKDAISATQETAGVRQELSSAKLDVRRSERDVARLQGDLEAAQRRYESGVENAASASELERTKQALSRAERELRDAQAHSDATLSRLREKSDALVRAEKQIATLRAERTRVTVAVEAFERDLKTQSLEAGRLREQITMLRDSEASVLAVRAELERVDRERGKVRDEAKRLGGELSRLRNEMKGLERWKVGHSCGGDTQTALSEQRARFKAQTRDLGAQIRYLKAKFTREATFRNGLSLQKRYLLLLVGGMSLNEQATLKIISQMGFPVPEPSRPKRTLKAVGLAVLGLIRARRSAAAWREEKESKADAAAQFAERRRVSGRS